MTMMTFMHPARSTWLSLAMDTSAWCDERMEHSIWLQPSTQLHSGPPVVRHELLER